MIFSKEKKYDLSNLIKRTGLKYVTEEEKYYVLSTRYAKGKVYKNKEVGLRESEMRVILWIDKETLFPVKVNMISAKYIIETEFKNFEVNFDINEDVFTIEKTTTTKIVELK